MPTPDLRPFPRISDVKSLFALSPTVEDAGADEADGLGPDGVVRYRFFRGCELAPFIATTDRFQSLNAWYLSDAAFLAYANADVKAARAQDLEAAGEDVARRIRPALTRAFEAIWKRDGRAPAAVTVKVFVRASPLEGLGRALVDPVQCYVADDGAVGFVAFRGTLPDSLPNWLTDFDPRLVALADGRTEVLPTGGGARVHAGFRAAARALLDDLHDGATAAAEGLRSYLKKRFAQSPGLRLWVSGHSLGGALATLCAYELGNVQALYTFGAPRVGDGGFARVFSQADVPHYRLVHHHDVVPQVPIPVPVLFPYEHVGDLKYLEYARPDAVHSDDPRAVGSRISDSMALERQLEGTFADGARWLLDEVGRLKIGFLADGVEALTDHAPLYYSNLLWNAFVKERARLLGERDPA